MARSGFLALIAARGDGETLAARVDEDMIAVDVNDADAALRAIRELLERTGILTAQGNSDWQI
jgi:hypothetical protein